MTEATAAAPPPHAAAAAPPPKRRRTPLIIGGSIALVLVVIAAVTVPLVIAGQRHAAAEARYSAASDDYNDALDVAQDAVDVLEAAQASALETRALADEVVAIADPAYVDAAALQSLNAAALALTEALEVSDSAPEVPGRLGAAPDETEALERRAGEIAGQVDDVRSAGEQYTELAAGVEAARTATDAAGEAFMASLPASVATVDAAFVSATNVARIDYRAAAAALGEGTWDADADRVVSQYVFAASVLAESHAAEEAQKAGPLYGSRRAVEQFARSIAGGVMLDFDWAPIVNGYGGGGSYGGTATWNTAHGGYSTITLSDSVAAMWQGNPAVASLVVHEVGHSITGKCIDLFKSGFGSQAEVFATAWAIGLGYDQDGSGESLYGRPSDELIELSKQCR